jgi:hypothetical protein
VAIFAAVLFSLAAKMAALQLEAPLALKTYWRKRLARRPGGLCSVFQPLEAAKTLGKGAVNLVEVQGTGEDATA